MSEARFTPGPWAARDCGTSRIVVARPWASDHRPEDSDLFGSYLGGHVASMDFHTHENGLVTRERAEANAHLIASAPTLYGTAAEVAPALRRLIAEMNLGPDDEGRDWYEMLTACADDLDAAMAKARGEA